MSWNRTTRCNKETILLIQKFELKYNSEVILALSNQSRLQSVEAYCYTALVIVIQP